MFNDILDNDDLVAIKMLLKDEKMNPAEKRHYLLGVDWEQKLNDLREVNNNFFNDFDFNALSLLTAGEKLSMAEKRHYVIGGDISKKIDKIISTRTDWSNNYDISTVEKGDLLLMKFEKNNLRNHFWCEVTNIDTTLSENNKPILTLKISEELNQPDKDQIIEVGLDKRKSYLLLDYCKIHYNDLEVGEKAFNNRVLEIEKGGSIRVEKKNKNQRKNRI